MNDLDLAVARAAHDQRRADAEARKPVRRADRPRGGPGQQARAVRHRLSLALHRLADRIDRAPVR